jgi:hypothetical protein
MRAAVGIIRRRKDAYEALHPETRNGENQHSRVRQVGEGSPAERFTSDTAKKTGQSERSVQRDAARGERVASEVLSKIVGPALFVPRSSSFDRGGSRLIQVTLDAGRYVAVCIGLRAVPIRT